MTSRRSDWKARFNDGPPLDLLYVGTLPPHEGGSARVAAQLLPLWADAGHRVRALGPWPENRPGPDAFALSAPRVGLTRYGIPFLTSSRDRLVGAS